MELDKNKVSLPLVVTRGFIMFPHNSASLDIIKEESEKAIKDIPDNEFLMNLNSYLFDNITKGVF